MENEKIIVNDKQVSLEEFEEMKKNKKVKLHEVEGKNNEYRLLEKLLG